MVTFPVFTGGGRPQVPLCALIIQNILLLLFYIYNEVPLIIPPIVLVESGLNCEQVSLMRPIYTEKNAFRY